MDIAIHPSNWGLASVVTPAKSWLRNLVPLFPTDWKQGKVKAGLLVQRFKQVIKLIFLLFSFSDLLAEDNSQGTDTADGQSWPNGAGIKSYSLS